MVEQGAFEGLKRVFVLAPVLVMPNMEAAFWVGMDTLDFVGGGDIVTEGSR